MIQTGFESRVKVQQIIDNQLPEFILDESPKFLEFFKQYYISQEYQGGPVDITDNLDQYLKVDNLTPEVIVGFTTLSENISSTSSTIQVTSTKGFPQKYGLLKIDDEIITYTGLTTNTFTGCIRGFSGITNYHKDLNFEELVFSTSDSSSHATSSKVENLSSLFLQEFYKKVKYTLTPDLENKNFVSSLNVGNFIKEARTLYQTKGTEESFRILFNVLFGETPKIINLEDYLIKPSSANYIRRLIVVADAVSGNPVNLEGQTITRTTDSNTTASVSEVEVIKRKNKTYYKLLLFIGYDDPPTPVTGEFKITGSTKNIESVSIGSSAITVDSTIGFPQAGTIYCGDNVIKYTDKSINQFFGCSGITSSIDIASVIFSEDTYFGYENGDKSKKVVLRLTGVLTGYTSIESNSIISVGERIGVKSIGKLIQNPDTNKSYKEIFSNSWIYNTSSRYEIIDNFTPNVSSSQITLKSVVDPSSLKVGDFIEILFRNTETVVQNNLKVNNISINGSGLYQITTNSSFILSSGSRYDIRRKIKNASSSVVPFEVEPITSDIQNIYDDSKNTYMYVASNSLPSYEITKSLCSYEASGVSDLNVETGLYSKITFSNKVSFFTGNEIYYKPSETSISGLVEGIYYVEVLSGNLEIRLYPSKSVVGTSNYLSFGSLTEGTHSFILNSQKEEVLSPQKILRKFPLSVNNGDGKSDETPPGATGILVNGVEIFNYKTINKIYYGPLEKVNVLNGGKNYDVINPPLLTLSTGDGLVQSCINGSVEKIYVTPQNFDTDVIVSIALTGGNGSGAVFQPIIEKKRREINFDARLSTFGGGVNVSTETITFLTEHNLIDGQEITYRSLNNTEVGIGTYLGSNTTSTGTLKDETTYYAEYVNNFTIRLYPSIADYRSGINTIGFTTSNASGIQRFVTEVRNTLSEIKVLDGGSNYRNRKLRVSPSGISTTNNFISFINHGFNDGEKVKYSNTGNSLVGLSTDNQYYVLKIDDNSFRLANAGIGGTIRTNYERKAYVGLGSTVGSGYHIFSDPEISIKVEYSSVGLSTNQYNGLIDCTPVVRGEISSVYVYEGGNGYGSSILNYHKKPIISVKNGKDAQCKPIIIDGKIEDVAIQFGGSEYYSNPDINAVDLSGSGKGAVLKPVIVNNKLTDVVIVNTGIGYSSKDTRIEVIPSGKNAIFDSQVRSLTVNDNFLYGTISNTSSLIIPANEILKSSYNNLQYGVCGYFQKAKDEFDDNNANKHSPIIGWAYDGNPIYGSFGYSNPGINSSVRRLNSGYSLNISNVNDRPVGFSSGFFVEDYQFTNSGDLDEYNGRFCVTKDFPQGVYAYFATTEENNNGETVGKFPYFIGSRYRSKFIEDNKSLDQTYDFNNSSLIRNTFPYKIGDRTASNDFIIESNEVINQFSVVESVTSGSVESFDIISSGDDYRVGETLVFDETETGGGGLIAQISELSGKDIVSLENQTLEYNDAIFEWKNGNQIKVKIFPYHNLNDLDYVSISGFSSSLSTLNGINRIGINSFTTSLLKDIPSLSSGIVTDVYVSSIPENISVGSSIKIGSGTLSILNIFNNQNIVRVISNESIAIQTATTPVYFTPDSFTIDKSIEYFDSTVNDLVYFNPSYSIGIGTTAGTDVEVAYNVGVQTSNTILIPTQSIYLPNHPFRTNQVVTLRKPPAGGSTFTVSNTSGGPTFSIPSSGDSQTVYIIRKSADHVGIVTQIGLTTSTNGLFFTSFVGGSYDYQYSLESNFTQIKGDVKKITTTVSISTEHNLSDGDTVSLFVSPQLSVGIGTSSFVKILREENTNYILANPINFNSTGVNTTTNTITISSHGLKTGDRVKYSADTVISGLSTGFYYVYKVDSNKIKLTETYIDAAKTDPPLTISFNSTGGSSQIISLVNPHISAVKNNDLVFDVSDSSLFGYNFKLFYDNEFYDEFVSIGSTNIFVISGVGTIGLSTNATVTLRYNDSVPSTLFYALEKSGDIVSVDNELRESSKITYNNSVYQNSYKVFGVGTTTFNICLTDFPEKNSYSVEECDTLRYTTSSTSALGGVEKIRILSPGFNFKKLPIFDVVDSTSGTGAYVKPNSKSIGKINEIRIVNEGFEYSSDKTLRPESSVSRFMYVENSNTINSVQVLYGGRNYISAPNIVIIDSFTGEKIDSGLFKVNLTAASNSIESITIDVPPKGLPESIVTLKTINNTNGVGIKTVQYSSSGIVTCYLITPSSGFSTEPFVVGDRIFVEGIQKETNDGTGFNSEDYGYEFFEIDSYTPSTAVPSAILTYDISGFTTNAGTPKLFDNSFGNIINFNNYPQFKVIQDFTTFTVGETLSVKNQNTFNLEDLNIVETNKNYIKVSGSYNLQVSDIIKGSQSGTIATINNIEESSGQFNVDYGNLTRVGWYDNIGRLNEDRQVIPDNDYYQNLSYSVKSSQKWEDIVSPVNNILHPSGLKNFADTEVINNVSTNSISVDSNQFFESILSFSENLRVDTINNFDLAVDTDVFSNRSKFLKLKNKKLTDYFKVTSNRVLTIDDISNNFSTSDAELNTTSKITDINSSRKFNRYLIQIGNKNNTEYQFTEIIVLNNNSETFTFEKGTINSGLSSESGYETNIFGSVYGFYDENTDDYYLKFDPNDAFVSSYNIKYLYNTFNNFTSGIGSTAIGFVDLIGVTETVSSGSTTTLVQKSTSTLESLHSIVHVIDNISGEMNYVELFVDHDGTNTNIAEFYFDTDEGLSSNFIGTFGSSISGGVIKINYTNTSNNEVTLRTKNIGFSTISAGIQTYRFKQSGQLDEFENTVKLDSSYITVSTASTILSRNKNLYTSVKSTVRVSVGETSALHQVMMISDGTSVSTMQYPFLSIGSTLGIGTFGGEIDASEMVLKFYPDSSFEGSNIEILNFNESFYKENDYVNVAPNLEYSNILESVGVSKFLSVNDDEVNKLTFSLKYEGTPIFAKSFNPSNSSVLNPVTGEFTISNHFFSTGEELIYTPKTTFAGVSVSPVGIGSTLNYVGVVTNILPDKVYAIKINNDKFKIATREEYANSGIAVTFTSLGSGNAHQFEMVKKNEKTVIAVNNVIQEPVVYALLNYTIDNGGPIGSSTTTFGLSGISSIRVGDILKVNNEYMKITNVGLGTSYSGPISFAGTFPLVSVERGFVGSSSTIHSNSGIASVYRGSFNIVGSDIYFTSPPRGNLEDRLFSDIDGLEESRDYFSGRVFLRKNYDDNKVYDNISERFTGIGQTYTLTVNGNNSVGLGTSGSNGLIFINGIYQTPTTENNPSNNFTIQENQISGISSVVFSGITSSNGSLITSDLDVNLNQLPRGGLIVSLGSSGGLGYAPLVGASVTAIVGAGGAIVSVGIGTSGDLETGNWGSGYRSPVSVLVLESGHSGSAATITATVGAGGTLSFNIIDGGTGYVNPSINISSPSYSSLPVTGVSRLSVGATTDCGVGLLLDIDVGASSTTGIGSTLFEVKGFSVRRSGYGFKPGDVVKPVGLVTAYGLSNPVSEFQVTILDTFTDSFSAIQFGTIDYIDSIKKYQNGSRNRFPLYYNGSLLSFEKDTSDPDSQLIDLNSILIVFVNGLLQVPGESYQFEGGTSFTFNAPPKEEDEIAIYFYRGSSDDSSQVRVVETLKIGDSVQVFKNNTYPKNTISQDPRVISDIISSDTIETNLYSNQGIDSINYKPISWQKQKVDKFINGSFVSKARDSIESQVYPTAKIIKSFGSGDSELFVDSVSLFNYEGITPIEIDFDALIISGNADVVSAAVTAVVSSSGTVQSLTINNVGSGYTDSSVDVKISNPPASIVGFGTTLSVTTGITATASISVVNGSLAVVSITNPGSGYTSTNPPQVLVPPSKTVYENITNLTGIAGTVGTIIGIGTTVGVGTALAINFKLDLPLISSSGISTGYPIYIFNTKVGNGVTSIDTNDTSIVGISTTFLDNVYYVSGFNNAVGVITCNVHSATSIVGIATTGLTANGGVGNFSWGKLSGFSRGSQPISIDVSGFTVNSGLTTFPTIQRRGFGFKSIGAITENI